jgi:hypothetical protein
MLGVISTMIPQGNKKIFDLLADDARMKSNLCRGYLVIFADVDFKNKGIYEDNLNYLKYLRAGLAKMKHPIMLRADVYSTKKGYHYKIYVSRKVSGFFKMKVMLRLCCDTAFINTFLNRGEQTLFSVRRGVNNEKFRESI